MIYIETSMRIINLKYWVPLILNGLYAPGQGWFPKYAGGYYRTNQQHHIIGRGLQRDGLPIPLFYNPPELEVVHLQPN